MMCDCDACVECLARRAPSGARRAVIMRALRLAWKAAPHVDLTAILGEAEEFIGSGHGQVRYARDLDMLQGLQAFRRGADSVRAGKLTAEQAEVVKLLAAVWREHPEMQLGGLLAGVFARDMTTATTAGLLAALRASTAGGAS